MNWKKWDERYIELAKFIANWSKDPSTKVGAVIVDNKGRIVSLGFNGFPQKISDNDRLNDRDKKYNVIVHAEANAIAKVSGSTQSTEGATLYITLSPCRECSKLIFQSGIKRVVYSKKYKDQSGIEFLAKSGVEVDFIEI